MNGSIDRAVALLAQHLTHEEFLSFSAAMQIGLHNHFVRKIAAVARDFEAIDPDEVPTVDEG